MNDRFKKHMQIQLSLVYGGEGLTVCIFGCRPM